ncbi:MAG: hypothetical protein VX766_07100 [Pseudomonadota bacterium]|nr:hypothetical protein [Pseudomonadota bacterium]
MGAWMRAVLFGAALGLAIAIFFSGGIVVWEVAENPGAIFRTPDGWRWDRMLDTGWSWLLPVAAFLAPMGAVAALLRFALRRARPSETP